MQKIIVILLILILGVVGYAYYQNNKSFGGGQTYLQRSLPCQTATTSPNYMTAAAASSTCMVNIADVRDLNYNICITASSTATVLAIENYLTMDSNTATRNWFGVRGVTIVNNLGDVIGSSTKVTSFAPATTTTTCLSVPMIGLRGNYLKIVYALTGANGAVYLEPVKEVLLK